MFTGIVENTGIVESLNGQNPIKLAVRPEWPPQDIVMGESIAINGCCLTVVRYDKGLLFFDVTTETQKRTTLTGIKPAGIVNLERAMRLSDRVGGSLVLGHVDGIGYIKCVEQRGGATYVSITATNEVIKMIVSQGGVTVDGVALTVVTVEGEHFVVSLIPHTLSITTLKFLTQGQPVNLEVDAIGRYVWNFWKNYAAER